MCSGTGSTAHLERLPFRAACLRGGLRPMVSWSVLTSMPRSMAWLAMWRIQTHEQFGGTWLSNYVPNRLGGFVHEPLRYKPSMPLVGLDGNIFSIMGRVICGDLFYCVIAHLDFSSFLLLISNAYLSGRPACGAGCVEFARQKAQEVFQVGDIPVCPHLMFPPIADPENPQQDQAAQMWGVTPLRKLGLPGTGFLPRRSFSFSVRVSTGPSGSRGISGRRRSVERLF